MSIPGELERARQLALAADEEAAKDLLLSLVPRIEQTDSDDEMLEVLAQLGEIYLSRSAYDGALECTTRIDDCVAVYSGILAGTGPEQAADVRMSPSDIDRMVTRYTRRAQFLRAGLAAARGDHEGAENALTLLRGGESSNIQTDLEQEHRDLVVHASILCATALCDDDLHVRSLPLWELVIPVIDGSNGGTDSADKLLVLGGTAYGRYCIETGRLSEGERWLHRAESRARTRDWELHCARAELERAAASWSRRDHLTTEQLVSGAYPVIARYARAHDVARCWLYLGLTRMGIGALQAADECWENAERHWRELGRPLYIHRILLQRSWIAIVRGRFADAVESVAQARDQLDSWPRAGWLQYARLDDHLGTIWRADALADLGFDGAGDPSETWQEAEARFAGALGTIRSDAGTAGHRSAMTKFETAAKLKVPAALAVDSVRYSIADADARWRWGTYVSARILAGAFAVAWEWENTAVVSELIEYHCARGVFGHPVSEETGGWATVATAAVPVADVGELAAVAAGRPAAGASTLTTLGPLPPLQMDPDSQPLLGHYRALALSRYGQDVTGSDAVWSTWP